MTRRVVVTGISILSPMGLEIEQFFQNLGAYKNSVRRMDEWDKFKGMHTRLAAPIVGFEKPEHLGRKETRSMGRVAILSVYATELALRDAGLWGEAELKNGRTGVAYGSSSGSIDAILDFYSMLATNITRDVTSSTYLKMMAHTCAVNISVLLKLTGRLVPTGTACTSGSLAIGNAYELIRHGTQEIMIAGGAEELSPTQVVVFDTLYATSTMNDAPELTPKPYDKGRDGLVIGEGAGTLILEEYEHAKARGAKIYAEIIGFSTNTDGTHITQPNMKTMAIAIRDAITSSGVPASEIGYVSGHGTATTQGDVAETLATREIFGRAVPISSLKSYIGHTLGACGAIESITAIEMMNRDWYHPTLNLQNIDPACGDLDYIKGEGRKMQNAYVINNNFAFGGINTSLVFKRM
ncbi:MAG: beta-ketoacyl-ACP synthase [Holophagaceae bacterium]|nr:beta-ketoacyl-ACP synthase [Holophagaceae bacterium]